MIKHFKAAHAMGIYDAWWLDDNSFLSCSADNNIKCWSVDADAAVYEMTQNDAKRDPSRQLLCVRKVPDGRILAVNLSGDFCFWNDAKEFSQEQRHMDLMSMMAPLGKDIYYSSAKELFAVVGGEKTIRCEVTNKNNIKCVYANASAVFCADLDKVISRVVDYKETHKVTLGSVGSMMAVNDSEVFVVTASNELVCLNAADLSTKKQQKMSMTVSSMTVCGDNIWIGDKSGVVHVLDASSFAEKTKFEGQHSKTVDSIASNGKTVASGDAYRYICVWDNATLEKLAEYCHKDRIVSIFVDESEIVSSSLNNDWIRFSIADKKELQQEKLVHGRKAMSQVIRHNGSVHSQGADCCIRASQM